MIAKIVMAAFAFIALAAVLGGWFGRRLGRGFSLDDARPTARAPRGPRAPLSPAWTPEERLRAIAATAKYAARRIASGEAYSTPGTPNFTSISYLASLPAAALEPCREEVQRIVDEVEG